jgi:hypothetical protein
MIVTLTRAEFMTALGVAARRQLANRELGNQHHHGASMENTWDMEIEGAAGEMAVAKGLGIYWNGAIGDWKADDVGQLQVRTTKYDDGCLILHKSDPADKVFILAVGTAPTFRLAGWIVAKDGMKDSHWKDPTGRGRFAYFVPQSALFRNVRHLDLKLP